jgi:hypothetical protein
MMKTCLALFAVTTAAAFGKDVIPVAFDKSRYDEMFASTPFVLATPIAPPPPAEEVSPLTDMYITSMTAGVDGKRVIYVKKPSDERGTRLVENEAESGIVITKINWGDGRKTATVNVTHSASGKSKELRFSDDPSPKSAGPLQKPPVSVRGVKPVPPIVLKLGVTLPVSNQGFSPNSGEGRFRERGAVK